MEALNNPHWVASQCRYAMINLDTSRAWCDFFNHSRLLRSALPYEAAAAGRLRRSQIINWFGLASQATGPEPDL